MIIDPVFATFYVHVYAGMWKIISELGAAEGKAKSACNVNFMIMLGIAYLSYLRMNEMNDIVVYGLLCS